MNDNRQARARSSHGCLGGSWQGMLVRAASALVVAGCESGGEGTAGAGGSSGVNAPGGVGGSSGSSGGSGAGAIGAGTGGAATDAGPWEHPAGSFCASDGLTVLAALPSMKDYAVVDDDLYVLSSNEQNGTAWADLEVSPAGGGPAERIVQEDQYGFGLEVDDESAYLITRPQELVLGDETYDDWRVLRVALGSLEQEALAMGNVYWFTLGEAGVFVYEPTPQQLVLYTPDGQKRLVCPTPGLNGALQRGDQVVWWSYNAIWVCPLAGGEAAELAPGQEKDPDYVVADATHVYWAAQFTPGIQRLSLSGLDPVEALVADVMPTALALDAEHLYFAAGMLVQRLALNQGASDVPEDFAELMDGPYSLLPAGDFLYFAEYGDQQYHCVKRLPK